MTSSGAHLGFQASQTRYGRGLYPFEITEIVERELATPKFRNECMPQYIASVKDYIIKVLVEKIAATREEHGMFDATVRDSEWDEDTDLSLGASGRFIGLTPNLLLIQCRCG